MSSSDPAPQQAAELRHGTLNFLGTIGQPLGIEGPTASAFIVPALTAGIVGVAAPLAFLLGTIIGLFVAFAFSMFARRYATAGSIYGFNSVALGPNYGFSSAWILLLAYIAFAAATGPLLAILVSGAFPAWASAVPWQVTALVLMGIAGLLVYRSISVSAKVAAVVEFIGIACLVIIGITVLAKGGYGGHNLSWTPFTFSKGLSLSSLGFGITFTFLAYAGFESAASLGEESKNPTRSIPRAMFGGILLSGAVMIFAAYILVVGFPSVTSLAASSDSLVVLADRFVGTGVGRIIAIAALLSGFGAAISNLNAASRMLYAFGRDGFVTKRLAYIHPRFGTPVVSLAVVWVIQACLLLAFSATTYLNVFGWFGTTGSFAFVIAYLSTVIGAAVHFRRYIIAIIPACGIIIVAFVLYKTVWPIPPYPVSVFVYFGLGWLILGPALLLASPRLRRQIASSPYLTRLKDSSADVAEARTGA